MRARVKELERILFFVTSKRTNRCRGHFILFFIGGFAMYVECSICKQRIPNEQEECSYCEQPHKKDWRLLGWAIVAGLLWLAWF
jgi:hypothetical protein